MDSEENARTNEEWKSGFGSRVRRKDDWINKMKGRKEEGLRERKEERIKKKKGREEAKKKSSSSSSRPIASAQSTMLFHEL